jgi:hypothetical protein
MSTQATRDGTAADTGSAKADDLFNIDDRLQQGMQRLADISQELVHASVEGDSRSVTYEFGDLASLRQENAELRARIDDLERALQTREMAMAKDRAELARQRNVILRLHQELNALVIAQ